jgi:hypothetical protein
MFLVDEKHVYARYKLLLDRYNYAGDEIDRAIALTPLTEYIKTLQQFDIHINPVMLNKMYSDNGVFRPMQSGVFMDWSDDYIDHECYQNGDEEIAPDDIRDSNNQIVKAMCKKCGATETELNTWMTCKAYINQSDQKR